MVRIPSPYKPEPETNATRTIVHGENDYEIVGVLLPEPDHAPEIEMRAYYEGLRDDGWAWAYEGVRDWREHYLPLELPEPVLTDPPPAKSSKRHGSTGSTAPARYCTFCANGFHSRCTGSGGATNPPREKGLVVGPTSCECGDADHEPGDRVLDAMARYSGVRQ